MTGKSLCVGMLAHVDAGKTTLIEAMLYLSGAIRKLGRVDHRDSYLDNEDQERARGITIFSKQARLQWGNTGFTILDTPGHVDFSSEMERTLQVMDAAVLVISGPDGVQAHTETLRVLLERYRIPTFCFITKMDVSFRSREELTDELQAHLSRACIDMTQERTSLEENAAMLDEEAFELYSEASSLSDDYLKKMISARRLIPCYFGSGIRLDGVEALLDALSLYTEPSETTEDFGARVFKIARDNRGKRLTYLKIPGGSLSVRSSIRYLPLHSSVPLEEKISEIRLYSGVKYENAENIPASGICAVLGLSQTRPGQGLGACPDAEMPVLEPVMSYRLLLPKGADPGAVLPKLRQLEEEDPQLHIACQEETGDIQLQLMGSIQLEVLKKLLSDRFDLDVNFDPGRILYRETIAGTAEGVGHYE
ncbi:MAG: TetM/TetW/TetO/TetS family tetracycline resistance ribosomal protection protein, partial [Oscillospiraceae bacterium]|nr:TetM/TetW/TetO/TetS family tetracycline resistance ribosomal protection protein [Oscillospiraceae bacterium]